MKSRRSIKDLKDTSQKECSDIECRQKKKTLVWQNGHGIPSFGGFKSKMESSLLNV